MPTWIDYTVEHNVRADDYLTIECELGFDVTPGEPMVRYYPDGSGYPGSPARAELIEVRVKSIGGDGWELKRTEAPELFAFFQQWLPSTQGDSYWEELFFDRYVAPEPPDHDDY
jgi:hypothetical protein